MKINKRLALLLFTMIFSVSGCSTDKESENAYDKEAKDVYQLYVEYMQASGGTPKTYEEWLASIRGEKGDPGNDGSAILNGIGEPQQNLGKNGDYYFNTQTWDLYIKENGYWLLKGKIKGDKGEQGNQGNTGENGKTPYIGENGNWWIDGQDLGVKAQGPQGSDGQNGHDGKTPYIGSNGNWWIGTTDTNVYAGDQVGQYCTVVFYNSKTGTIEDNYKIKKGEKINPPESVLFSTSDWFYVKDNRFYKWDFDNPVTNDIKLYGSVEVFRTYHVILDATLGECENQVMDVDVLGHYSLPTPVCKDGRYYRDFEGWYLGDQLIPNEGDWVFSVGDCKLTAHWSEELFTIPYDNTIREIDKGKSVHAMGSFKIGDNYRNSWTPYDYNKMTPASIYDISLLDIDVADALSERSIDWIYTINIGMDGKYGFVSDDVSYVKDDELHKIDFSYGFKALECTIGDNEQGGVYNYDRWIPDFYSSSHAEALTDNIYMPPYQEDDDEWGKSCADNPCLNTEEPGIYTLVVAKYSDSSSINQYDYGFALIWNGELDDPIYERKEDSEVYDKTLAEYASLMADAKTATSDSLSCVKYAKAEANLLDSALLLPTYSEGVGYALTRQAPHTNPFTIYGNDAVRLRHSIMVNYDKNCPFITASQIEEMNQLWENARKGGADYDPVAYLLSKGYVISDSYNSFYDREMNTYDILGAQSYYDRLDEVDFLSQTVEGLIEYDEYGMLQPRIAKSLPTISDDGLTYTFTIREGLKWVTANGNEYADITADDFVAGFQHMLDAKCDSAYLVYEMVDGAEDYFHNEAPFSDVGIKAIGENKLQITLTNPDTYFTRKVASVAFLPMNRAFYLSKGGEFGDAYNPNADSYLYGQVGEPSSILYNSAYIIEHHSKNSFISFKTNPLYDLKNLVQTKHLYFNYDNLYHKEYSYYNAVSGNYDNFSIDDSTVMNAAKTDGIFEDYAYITDSSLSIDYGGINVNRGTFTINSVVSNKTEQEKIDTENAFLNVNFRRALQQAWDRATWCSTFRDEELARASLRNIITSPELCCLNEDIEYEGHIFTKGTSYGECVQYFLEHDYNRVINVTNGQDGWYNPNVAKAYAALAKDELEAEGKWNGKIKLEIVCCTDSEINLTQANAFEQMIESVLGKYVDVIILTSTSIKDVWACSTNAKYGIECCCDFSWDYLWVLNFDDPSLGLEDILPNGILIKSFGLY